MRSCDGRTGVQAIATLAKMAAGFEISESTAHAYTTAVVDLVAERAPGRLKVPCESDPDAAGRIHNLTAARTRRIIRICER